MFIFFEIDKKNLFELQHFKVTPPLKDYIDISRQVAQTSAELIPGQSNLEETKSIQATAPELGPVGLWSPKPSTFSGSDSIVVEEAARKFLSPQPSINKSREANSFIQHDKVEASKLCRYLETCGRALEQFLQLKMSSDDSITFLPSYSACCLNDW